MLSVEGPSEPSLPNTIAHERAPQGLACQEAADPQLPNFSIRDYVFAARGKSVEANWPFAHPLLRLCLKNGVKDVLPPFETPGSVRAQCGRKFVDCVEDLSLVDAQECLGHPDVEEAAIGQRQFVDSAEKAVQCRVNEEAIDLDELVFTDDPVVSTLTDDEPAEQIVNISPSEPPLGLEAAEVHRKVEKMQEPSEKKCRLIVKLGSVLEARQIDDGASNASAVSDPMASKVCPVCKTFASSSNTTLNAHIDQCLYVESNGNNMDDLPKMRVKPRKKRLMVDIYTTAVPYTLEDLDRRNGTNWAVELAPLSALPSEAIAVTDTKRQKMAWSGPRDDAMDDAVYVDSNGIKLRILSKFNDTPLPSEDYKVRNHVEEKNMVKKKKHLGQKFAKKMKMKAQKKKSNSFEVLKYQMQLAPERDRDTENNRQIDHESLPYGDGRSSTLRPWGTGKYSDVVGNSGACNNIGTIRPARKNLALENRRLQPPLNSSFPRRHSDKALKSTELLTGSSKTKNVDFLCRTVNTRSNNSISISEQSSESSLSANGFLPKLSRSSKDFMSLPSKSIGLQRRVDEKSENSSQLTSSPTDVCATTERSDSILKGNQFTSKSYFPTDEPSSSKLVRKHRSKLRTAKRSSLVRPHGDGLYHFQPSTLESVAGVESRNRITGTERAPRETEKRKYLSTVEMQEDDSMDSPRSEAEFQATVTEVKVSDDRVDSVDCGDFVTMPSDEPPTSDHLVGETTNAESPGMVFSSGLDADTCVETSEAHVLEVQLNSRSDIEDDVSGNDIDSQGMQVVVETETCNAEDDVVVQPIERRGDESSGCLTTELEESNKNSSITSVTIMVNQEQNLDSDADPAGLNVSPPSVKDSEPALASGFINIENGSNVQKEMQESHPVVNRNNAVQVTDKITDEKSFCCSCRESLSRDSQFLKQSTNVPTTKVKPVPNLVIGPRNSSSFTKYQNRSPNVGATSSLGSFSQYIFAQNSLDSTLGHPYYGDNMCSPSPSSQSTSNATLRLMGKNLVLNNDEHVQPQANTSVYQPTVIPSINGFHYPPTQGFSPLASATGHQLPLHLPNGGRGGLMGPLFTGSCMTVPDQPAKRSMHEHRAYNPPEVIVIDDSPERGSDFNGCITNIPTATLPLFTSGLRPLPQVQPSYFSLQTPVFEVSAPSRNVYPSVYPRVGSIGYLNRSNGPEYQAPILPSHVVYRSTGDPMTSSMFYSETMR